MSEGDQSDLIRSRATRLFSFLRDLAEIRSKAVLSLDQYDLVIWLSQIPKILGCHCVAWEEGKPAQGETWIEIQKPAPKHPPAIPRELELWLDPEANADSSPDYPELKEEIEVFQPIEDSGASDLPFRSETQHLADHPEVTNAWEGYIEKRLVALGVQGPRSSDKPRASIPISIACTSSNNGWARLTRSCLGLAYSPGGRRAENWSNGISSRRRRVLLSTRPAPRLPSEPGRMVPSPV